MKGLSVEVQHLPVLRVHFVLTQSVGVVDWASVQVQYLPVLMVRSVLRRAVRVVGWASVLLPVHSVSWQSASALSGLSSAHPPPPI